MWSINTPSGRTFIIDAGAQGGLDVYRRVLGPFLTTRKLPAPEVAFISHANSDHYSAMPALMERYRLAAVYLNDYFGRPRGRKAVPQAESDILGELTVGADKLIRIGPQAGRKIDLDDRTSVEVLWPPPGRTDVSRKGNVNDTSLVLRITCDGKTVLLPGDLDRIGQGELAERDVRADVLVLPHHGAWRKTLEAFVAAVAPDVVVVSSNSDPASRAGASAERKVFFSRLRTSKRYASTALDGWVRVRFGATGIDVRTMR